MILAISVWLKFEHGHRIDHSVDYTRGADKVWREGDKNPQLLVDEMLSDLDEYIDQDAHYCEEDQVLYDDGL